MEGGSSSRLRGPKSKIWDQYTLKTVKGTLKEECKHCSKLLSGNPKNGTKHLHTHYNDTCPARKGLSEMEEMVNANLVSNFTFNHEHARKELAHMIVLHEYPLSIVDHAGFRRYSHALQPLFQCPSRNTVKNDIITAYKAEKVKMMTFMESVESRVAITTDMWTANNQRKGYMVITTHFIDNTWALHSHILRFAYVPCPHTKEAICEVLFKSLLEWNIDNKISTITLDNCSTNDAMVKELQKKLKSHKLLLSGGVLHMRCCAHILNLIVQDGLGIIENAIEKVRDSVGYWTATPNRLERFLDAAKQLKIPVTKKSSLDCPTRWNSSFLMLQTALLYREVFFRLAQKDSRYSSLPSDEEWDLTLEICDKLKIFYDITEQFSGTKYPTSSLCFASICEIKMRLNGWLASSNEVIKKMVEKMKRKFDKYWSDIHVLMGVAAVLDPRFKMYIIRFYYTSIFGAASESEVRRLFSSTEECCDP